MVVMSTRKKFTLTKNKANIVEKRRTSLNVNLSYVSDPSYVSQRNETDEIQNLSKVKEIEGVEISNEIFMKIKPSFVNLTSTPIPSKYANLLTKKERRSNDRSTLQREKRLSEVSTVFIDTSMDITEVQRANYDSMNFIPDTECPEFNTRPTIPAISLIPDSQPDTSVDVIRASMNVNTSLDSVARLNLTDNFPVRYSPEIEAEIKSRENESGNTSTRDNSVLRSRVSDSGERNDATKKLANICEEISGRKENLNVNEVNEHLNKDREREKLIVPFNGTPVLGKSIRSSRLEYSSDSGSKNDSSSLSSSSSSSPLRGKNVGEIYQRIISSGLNKSRDLPGRSGEKKGKKKLMRLRASEIVDLSPVSVKRIRPVRGLICGKRTKRRNKTAKKLDRRKSDIAKKLSDDEDDDDEAKETRLLPRKEKKAKKVKAKKIVIKKMRDVELQKRMNKNANDERNDYSEEGDSSDDFEPKCNLGKRKTGGSRPRIIIVVTGLPFEEKKLVKDTVAQLGSAKLQKLVSRHTTHVVSKGIRTANLLRGIIRGCWVVSLEWISRSRETGNWLDAEAYEMRKFSEAVEKNRREKQFFKAAYASELFLACGSIYVGGGTSTPVSVLEELVRTAGGRVAPEAEKAKIIIGPDGLKEVWILDSITRGELQPLERYSKKKSSD